MAKGQKRSSKEARKPKSADKKTAGPKYMASAGLGQSGKPGVAGLGQKK